MRFFHRPSPLPTRETKTQLFLFLLSALRYSLPPDTWGTADTPCTLERAEPRGLFPTDQHNLQPQPETGWHAGIQLVRNVTQCRRHPQTSLALKGPAVPLGKRKGGKEIPGQSISLSPVSQSLLLSCNAVSAVADLWTSEQWAAVKWQNVESSPTWAKPPFHSAVWTSQKARGPGWQDAPGEGDRETQSWVEQRREEEG